MKATPAGRDAERAVLRIARILRGLDAKLRGVGMRRLMRCGETWRLDVDGSRPVTCSNARVLGQVLDELQAALETLFPARAANVIGQWPPFARCPCYCLSLAGVTIFRCSAVRFSTSLRFLLKTLGETTPRRWGSWLVADPSALWAPRRDYTLPLGVVDDFSIYPRCDVWNEIPAGEALRISRALDRTGARPRYCDSNRLEIVARIEHVTGISLRPNRLERGNFLIDKDDDGAAQAILALVRRAERVTASRPNICKLLHAAILGVRDVLVGEVETTGFKIEAYRDVKGGAGSCDWLLAVATVLGCAPEGAGRLLATWSPLARAVEAVIDLVEESRATPAGIVIEMARESEQSPMKLSITIDVAGERSVFRPPMEHMTPTVNGVAQVARVVRSSLVGAWLASSASEDVFLVFDNYFLPQMVRATSAAHAIWLAMPGWRADADSDEDPVFTAARLVFLPQSRRPVRLPRSWFGETATRTAARRMNGARKTRLARKRRTIIARGDTSATALMPAHERKAIRAAAVLMRSAGALFRDAEVDWASLESDGEWSVAMFERAESSHRKLRRHRQIVEIKAMAFRFREIIGALLPGRGMGFELHHRSSRLLPSVVLRVGDTFVAEHGIKELEGVLYETVRTCRVAPDAHRSSWVAVRPTWTDWTDKSSLDVHSMGILEGYGGYQTAEIWEDLTRQEAVSFARARKKAWLNHLYPWTNGLHHVVGRLGGAVVVSSEMASFREVSADISHGVLEDDVTVLVDNLESAFEKCRNTLREQKRSAVRTTVQSIDFIATRAGPDNGWRYEEADVYHGSLDASDGVLESIAPILSVITKILESAVESRFCDEQVNVAGFRDLKDQCIKRVEFATIIGGIRHYMFLSLFPEEDKLRLNGEESERLREYVRTMLCCVRSAKSAPPRLFVIRDGMEFPRVIKAASVEHALHLVNQKGYSGIQECDAPKMVSEVILVNEKRELAAGRA